MSERERIVAWLRAEAREGRAEITDYRGRGDTTGALCAGERIITLRLAAEAIERGDHLDTPNA